MSEQPPARPQEWASAIPYVEHHSGPRRLLTLHVTTQNTTFGQQVPPVVSIDGRQYIVYWGSMSFEIPADRPVHVSVHIEGETMTQAASTLLQPGADLALRYATHFMAGIGELTQVG